MPCALPIRAEEHTSELQSHDNLVCRLLLEKTKKTDQRTHTKKRSTLVATAEEERRASEPLWHSPCCAQTTLSPLCWTADIACFFLNDPAPPKLTPLPPRAAFPT